MLLSFSEYSPWSEAFQITLQPPRVYSFKSELYEKHNIIHSRRFLNQDAFQMECSVCVRLSNLSKWFKNFTLRDHLSRNRFWLAAARPPWLKSGFSAAGTTRAPLNWTMATGRSLLNAAGQVFPSVLTLTFRLKVYESRLSCELCPQLGKRWWCRKRLLWNAWPIIGCWSAIALGAKTCVHLLWFRSWHGWVTQGQSDWHSHSSRWVHSSQVKLRLPPCC